MKPKVGKMPLIKICQWFIKKREFRDIIRTVTMVLCIKVQLEVFYIIFYFSFVQTFMVQYTIYTSYITFKLFYIKCRKYMLKNEWYGDLCFAVKILS